MLKKNILRPMTAQEAETAMLARHCSAAILAFPASFTTPFRRSRAQSAGELPQGLRPAVQTSTGVSDDHVARASSAGEETPDPQVCLDLLDGDVHEIRSAVTNMDLSQAKTLERRKGDVTDGHQETGVSGRPRHPCVHLLPRHKDKG